jgi:hypothetical protein
MKSTTHLSLSPGTALAVIALFFALGGSALAVGERVQSPSAAQPRCSNGTVRGVAYVRGTNAGMANIPDRFTSAGSLFGRKFNCTGKAVQVRRVETGVFEVRFAGISGASGVGSGTGDALAAVEPAAGGAFRVTMHPAGRDDKVDLPFTIVVV